MNPMVAEDRVIGTLYLPTLLREIVTRTADLLGAGRCGLFQVEAIGRRLRLRCIQAVGLSERYARDLYLAPGEAVVGRAVAERRTVYTSNLLTDPAIHLSPELRELVGAEGIGAVLAAPILLSEEPFGTLTVYRPGGHQFTPGEVEFVTCLAGFAAIAIENARLYSQAEARLDTVQRRHAAAQALLQVSQALTQTLDLDLVFDLIAEKVLAVTGADACGFARVTPEGNLQYVGAKGFEPPHLLHLTLLRGEGLMGRCLQVETTVWSQDLRADPAISYRTETRARAQMRGGLAVPILTAEGPYGVLFIGRRRPHDSTAEEIAFAEALAAQAAIAIQNARLFQDERERRRQLEGLRALTADLLREQDLSVLLGLINQQAARLVRAPAGVVFLWDDATQLLVPGAWHGFGECLGHVRQRLGEGIAGVAARQGEGLVVNDYRAWAHALPEALQRTTVTAAVAEPLLYRGRLLGVIVLGNQGTDQRFTEEDQALLQLFAAHAAVAIANARLYDDLHRQAREATALAEVARTLSGTLDIDRVLDLLVQEVRRLMGVPFAGVMIFDEERQELAYVRAAGLRPEHLATVRLKAGEGIAGRALADGVPVQSPNVLTDPRYVAPGLAEAQGFRALLCVPLLAGGRARGVLAVFRKEEHAFSPAEVQLLTRFADQAALAVENARLYQDLRRDSADLEDLVQARTRELREAQEELVRRERLALLGQLAGGVGHELRNPLGAIGNAAYYLRMRLAEGADPKVVRHLGILEREIRRANKIVTDLLDFSRIKPPQRASLDLNPSVKEVLARFPETPGLAMGLDLAGGLPPVQVDADQVAQILHNLLSNAVEAMPDGGALTVSTRATPEAVLVAVTDTGSGISPEHLEKVFQPLFTTKPHGIGLGLAVSRQLVEANGGSLTVTSRVGEGSTFTMAFPTDGPAGPHHA